MRQHLHAQRRAQRLQRLGGGVTAVGLAAILAATAILPASVGALPVRWSPGAPFPGGQAGCTIHVAYTRRGTPHDDSLHVPVRIQATVTDTQGVAAHWGARIEVPALKLRAAADSAGHAELVVPAAQLAGRDSLVVVVRGIAHATQTVTVYVAPGTVVTITAAMCVRPLDGPLGMNVLVANARPGVACRMSLTLPYPRVRRHGADSTTPAVIRATITDTAGAPLQQATAMLAIYRGDSVSRAGASADSGGHASFVAGGEQLASADSMVVFARRVGFYPQRLAARIVPGDTVVMTAVLCPDTRPLVEPTIRNLVSECRGADSDAVRLVHRFISGHQEFQSEHHMAPIESTTVRLLTDARDAKVCRTFNDAVSPEDQPATYVSAGNYYFIIVPRQRVRGDDGRWYFRSEWRPIAVFDQALNFIGVEGI